jgi:CheY-like chemotaxis protein
MRQILVIQEDETVRVQLSRLLLDLGYQTTSVETAEKSIDKLVEVMKNDSAFDLIIVGTKMPDSTNPEALLDSIITAAGNTKVLIYTGGPIPEKYRSIPRVKKGGGSTGPIIRAVRKLLPT